MEARGKGGESFREVCGTEAVECSGERGAGTHWFEPLGVPKGWTEGAGKAAGAPSPWEGLAVLGGGW